MDRQIKDNRALWGRLQHRNENFDETSDMAPTWKQYKKRRHVRVCSGRLDTWRHVLTTICFRHSPNSQLRPDPGWQWRQVMLRPAYTSPHKYAIPIHWHTTSDCSDLLNPTTPSGKPRPHRPWYLKWQHRIQPTRSPLRRRTRQWRRPGGMACTSTHDDWNLTKPTPR